MDEYLAALDEDMESYTHGLRRGQAEAADELAEARQRLAQVEAELVTARRWFFAVVALGLVSLAMQTKGWWW